MVITKDGATFEATELGKGNVEILKIEEFKTSPSFKPSLRVWMRIEGDLSPCNCKTAKDKLDEVFLIANFIDYSS